MKKIYILLILSVLLGCKKDSTTTTPSTANNTYSFEFTFKGQKYSWSGTTYPFTNGSAGASTLPDLKISLVNGAPGAPNYYPTLSIAVPNAMIGQYEANPSNGKPTTQNPYPLICGIALSNLKPASDVYSAGLGNGKVSINITEVGQGMGGHIKGTFSGTVYNLDGQSEAITGSFDAFRVN